MQDCQVYFEEAATMEKVIMEKVMQLNKAIEALEVAEAIAADSIASESRRHAALRNSPGKAQREVMAPGEATRGPPWAGTIFCYERRILVSD